MELPWYMLRYVTMLFNYASLIIPDVLGALNDCYILNKITGDIINISKRHLAIPIISYIYLVRGYASIVKHREIIFLLLLKTIIINDKEDKI
jgi:hypothetical protein